MRIYRLRRRARLQTSLGTAGLLGYGLLLLASVAIVHTLWHGVGTGLASAERQAAQRYGVPSALVEAVVQAESGGNPYAVSDQGALGLMQATPGKFRPGQDPFSPATNLDVGTRYLSSLLQEFHGNLRLALAAYNAGPGAVHKYKGVPPYPQTQAYVREVMADFRLIQKAGR